VTFYFLFVIAIKSKQGEDWRSNLLNLKRIV